MDWPFGPISIHQHNRYRCDPFAEHPVDIKSLVFFRFVQRIIAVFFMPENGVLPTEPTVETVITFLVGVIIIVRDDQFSSAKAVPYRLKRHSLPGRSPPRKSGRTNTDQSQQPAAVRFAEVKSVM